MYKYCLITVFFFNVLFSDYLNIQFASFSYTIGGSYGSCVKFKKAEYAFSQFNECSCAWAANDSSYPNCYDLFYDPQTKIIKYNLSEGGEYIYRNFSNDYTCHIYEEETGPLECTEIDYELQCSQNSECNWFENIELESCNDINSQQQCNAVGCNWYNGNYYACSICCWGEYEVDNSYCEETEYQLGDLNQDNLINVQDIIITMNLVLNDNYETLADINNDNIVNILDIVIIVDIILN